jgi:hypothetical protein
MHAMSCCVPVPAGSSPEARAKALLASGPAPKKAGMSEIVDAFNSARPAKPIKTFKEKL